MISSNLIKSDDELKVEIGKMVDYDRELQDDSTESKIIKFDYDFAEKLKIEVGVFSENRKNNLTKLNQNY